MRGMGVMEVCERDGSVVEVCERDGSGGGV